MRINENKIIPWLSSLRVNLQIRFYSSKGLEIISFNDESKKFVMFW